MNYICCFTYMTCPSSFFWNDAIKSVRQKKVELTVKLQMRDRTYIILMKKMESSLTGLHS